MAKKDGVDLAKVEKLLEALDELHERERAIVVELRAVFGGNISIGDLLKQCERKWADLWAERYRGSEYVWVYTKDRPQLKRLILKLGVVELQARMVNYIKSDEPFYVRTRHAFGAFVSVINQLAGAPTEAADLDLEPPADCRHDPPCTSDTQHTDRKLRELRGEQPF